MRSMLWIFLGLILWCLIVSEPFILHSSELQNLKEAIFKAEKEERWEDALKLGLDMGDKSEELIPHVNRLKETVEALEAAEIYQKAGLYNEAYAVLQDIFAKLEKITDRYLVLAVKKKLTKFEKLIYQPLRRESEKKVDFGFHLITSGKYDEAIQIFDEVEKAGENEVTDAVRRRAKQGKNQAEMAKIESTYPGLVVEFWDSFKEGLRKIFMLLLYFILAIIIFYILRWFHHLLFRRSGICINLENHTVPADEREVEDRELSLELGCLIRKIAIGGSDRTESGKLMDLDASNMPIAQTPFVGIAALETHIDAAPVKIGPFSFTPKQLFAYLGLLFKPRYQYTLSGVLKSDETRTILRIEKKENNGTSNEIQQFEASVPGNNKGSCDIVLKDAAAQIVVTLARSIVTSDWRSLRAYLDGEELLAREDIKKERENLLQEANNRLMESLRYDPANWMARYKLATVQRKLGENRAASEQFEYIERMLESEELKQSRHFTEFVKNKPEFLWLLRYNRAISLSKRGEETANSRALTFLNELIRKAEEILKKAGKKSIFSRKKAQINSGRSPNTSDVEFDQDSLVSESQQIEKEDVPGKPHPKKVDIFESFNINHSQARRILIFARSARSAANCTKLEFLKGRLKITHNDPDKQELKKSMEKLIQLIKEDEYWLWKYVKCVKSGEWQDYARAHAIAQNACGRAYFLMEQYKSAIRYLGWAIRIHMPCNFIDPYINLAHAYFKSKHRQTADWAAKTGQLLRQALAINPGNPKANYLLGRLYSHPSVGKYEEALAYLDKGGENGLCYYQKAEIQIEQNKNIEEGLKLLQQSVSIDPTPDYRYVRLLRLILEQARDKKANTNLLVKARNLANKLKNEGITSGFQELGTDFYDSLDKYIHENEQPKE